MFLGVETTFRHTFPSSDLQCLPPDDPRVLSANTGIRLLIARILHGARQATQASQKYKSSSISKRQDGKHSLVRAGENVAVCIM